MTAPSPVPCVLLTATVTPRGMPFTARSEPGLRLNDYLQALEYWLDDRSVRRLVFCENSGHDLAPIRALVARSKRPEQDVEILGWSDDDAQAMRGKGRGELRLVRHALQASSLLADASHVVKVTGRYRSPSAAHMIEQLRRRPDVDVICDLRKGLRVAESSVFLASRRFLSDYLLSTESLIDDSRGFWLEHALARAVHRALADGLEFELPERPVTFFGISGTSGRALANGPVKRLARAVLHRTKRFLLSR